jgi:N-methylhydantoinase A
MTERRILTRGSHSSRRAYYGPESGFIDTPVLHPADFPDGRVEGPVLIDKYDTTIVVPPGFSVHITANGSFVIDIGTSSG